MSVQERAQPVATSKRNRASNLNPDAEAQEAIRASIIETLRSHPDLPGYKVAARHGVHKSTVSRIKSALAAGESVAAAHNPPASKGSHLVTDRAEKWGKLLSRYAPLKLRAEVLNKLLTSDNPVSAGRALEIVLESDGLRKKIPTPGQQQMIVVAGSDDTGFA